MNQYLMLKTKLLGHVISVDKLLLNQHKQRQELRAQLLSEAGTAGTGQVTSNSGGSASGSKSAASGNMGTFGDFPDYGGDCRCVFGRVLRLLWFKQRFSFPFCVVMEYDDWVGTDFFFS